MSAEELKDAVRKYADEHLAQEGVARAKVTYFRGNGSLAAAVDDIDLASREIPGSSVAASSPQSTTS